MLSPEVVPSIVLLMVLPLNFRELISLNGINTGCFKFRSFDCIGRGDCFA